MQDDPLIRDVVQSEASWVINALGRIHQKSKDPEEMLRANAEFPVKLAKGLKNGQRLIHASTDCVFSGKRGWYCIDDPPDAEDAYGLTKTQGEAAADLGNCLVVRTSVIGPEQGGAFGLWGWLLSSKGTVPGYDDQVWNGVTTLEWAKFCLEVMKDKVRARRPRVQIGTLPAITKFELLNLIRNATKHDIRIVPTRSGNRKDMSLVPDVLRPPIAEQIRELCRWY